MQQMSMPDIQQSSAAVSRQGEAARTKNSGREDGFTFKDAIQKAVNGRSEQKMSTNKQGEAVTGQTESSHKQAIQEENAAPNVTATDQPEADIGTQETGGLIGLILGANVAAANVAASQSSGAPGEGAYVQTNQTAQGSDMADAKSLLADGQAKDSQGNAKQSGTPMQTSAQSETVRQGQENQTTAGRQNAEASGSAKNQAGNQLAEKPQGEMTGKPTQDASKDGKTELPGFTKPQAEGTSDKIVVKVGDGSSLKSEQFASNLSEKIMTKMSEGKQQFEIELTPRELGKIMIKIVMEGGKADVIMHCLNPKTQQMVMANAETIRGIVEAGTGLQTAISAKEDLQEHYGAGDFDGRGGQNDKEEQDESHKQTDELDWKLTDAEMDTFVHQLRLGLTSDL